MPTALRTATGNVYAIVDDGGVTITAFTEKSDWLSFLKAQAALPVEEQLDLSTRAPAPPPRLQLSPFDFLHLFTQAERIAILNTPDGIVKDAISLVIAIETFVDLKDPMTIELVGYLVSLGLLTQTRATAVLSGQTPT